VHAGFARLAAVLLLAIAHMAAAPRVEVLTPISSLPPDLVGRLREPAAFAQTSTGGYVVFDRRAQKIFGVDAARRALTTLVDIGPSDGQILQPDVIAFGPNRTFAVVDQPKGYERLQIFFEDGTPLGRVQRWPARAGEERLSVNGVTFFGLGAIALGRETVVAGGQQPGALMTEFDREGNGLRSIGQMRPTGHESDPLAHRALNAGIPLIASDGSLIWVFTTGVPLLRKYAADGTLLYERHIEGPELDGPIQSLPQRYPTRPLNGREYPAVVGTVTAAAIDADDRVWVSLNVPFTYVYDRSGEKVRTVQFRGTETMTPTSFFFTPSGTVLVTPGCFEFSAR
jgi:hypothetical protein